MADAFFSLKAVPGLPYTWTPNADFAHLKHAKHFLLVIVRHADGQTDMEVEMMNYLNENALTKL